MEDDDVPGSSSKTESVSITTQRDCQLHKFLHFISKSIFDLNPAFPEKYDPSDQCMDYFR